MKYYYLNLNLNVSESSLCIAIAEWNVGQKNKINKLKKNLYKLFLAWASLAMGMNCAATVWAAQSGFSTTPIGNLHRDICMRMSLHLYIYLYSFFFGECTAFDLYDNW